MNEQLSFHGLELSFLQPLLTIRASESLDTGPSSWIGDPLGRMHTTSLYLNPNAFRDLWKTSGMGPPNPKW